MPAPNRYDGFKFEPYVFRPYPKAVKHNGVDYVAQDQADEDRIKSTSPAATKETMIRKAHALGLKVDARWTIETIAEMVKTAEMDALQNSLTMNPDSLAQPSEHDLILKADKLGIKVDKRWGYEKIKSVVTEAEANVA